MGAGDFLAIGAGANGNSAAGGATNVVLGLRGVVMTDRATRRDGLTFA
jgi:hypothetical protein